MKAELYKIHKEWWYNNPQSCYLRYCQYCDHCINTNGDEKLCGWWNTSCYDAAQSHCPIPTAGVAMLMESEATFNAHIKASLDAKKGGTVVPPSNFQFGTTELPVQQHVISENPRPHGSAGAHARKEPLAPTSFFQKKCTKKDCPYYGQMAAYCQICGESMQAVHRLHPDMCASLIWGSCDGHACKCDRYENFDDWSIRVQRELGRENEPAYQGSSYFKNKPK